MIVLWTVVKFRDFIKVFCNALEFYLRFFVFPYFHNICKNYVIFPRTRDTEDIHRDPASWEKA